MKSQLLARLFKRLSDSFAERPLSDAPDPSQTGPELDEPAAPPPSTELTDANFARQMGAFDARAAAAGGPTIAGSVQLIGLEEIKNNFGALWKDIRDAAHKVTEEVIKSHLTPLDLFAAVQEESYVVLFGELGQETAEIKAKSMAAEITRRLCGDVDGGPMVTVRSVTLEIDRPEGGFKTVTDVWSGFERAQSKAAETAKAEGKRIAEGIQFGYWPTLNLRKRLIAIYDCNIMRRADAGYMLVGDDAYPRDPTGELAATLDGIALDAAHQGLRHIEQQGKRAVLLLPVHFETLAFRAFREKYMQGVRAFPESAQHNLAFHVLDLPAGVPQTRVVEVVSQFRPWVLGFVCRLPLARPEIERFTGSGLIGLTTDAGGTITPSETQYEHMRSFAAAAREAKLRSMFVNARTVSLASAAVRAGFDFVNGDAIVRMVARPGRVYQLEASATQPGGAPAAKQDAATAPTAKPGRAKPENPKPDTAKLADRLASGAR
ncbi:MAG: hypothetical protein FJX35_17850 [Alphaproteobacteria bacterium]|nr:hypothetical protein [Alphaproteobacteria bacterium]